MPALRWRLQLLLYRVFLYLVKLADQREKGRHGPVLLLLRVLLEPQLNRVIMAPHVFLEPSVALFTPLKVTQGTCLWAGLSALVRPALACISRWPRPPFAQESTVDQETEGANNWRHWDSGTGT